jgi:hypothetical protein
VRHLLDVRLEFNLNRIACGSPPRSSLIACDLTQLFSLRAVQQRAEQQRRGLLDILKSHSIERQNGRTRQKGG